MNSTGLPAKVQCSQGAEANSCRDCRNQLLSNGNIARLFIVLKNENPDVLDRNLLGFAFAL